MCRSAMRCVQVRSKAALSMLVSMSISVCLDTSYLFLPCDCTWLLSKQATEFAGAVLAARSRTAAAPT